MLSHLEYFIQLNRSVDLGHEDHYLVELQSIEQVVQFPKKGEERKRIGGRRREKTKKREEKRVDRERKSEGVLAEKMEEGLIRKGVCKGAKKGIDVCTARHN